MSSETRVIQIVPNVPPAVCGVGDYAFRLALELERRFCIHSKFIVCGLMKPRCISTDFETEIVSAGGEERLAAELNETEGEQSLVLLHSSPYGYSTDGAPFWLLRAIRQWKAVTGSTRLATYFHELYAKGAPWQRAFWYSPLQRRCTKGLFETTDFSVTNSARYQTILQRWNPNRQVIRLSVPSNIGEPSDTPGIGERPPLLVVLGSAEARLRVFERFHKQLAHAIEQFGITEACEIGPGPCASTTFTALEVRFLGLLRASEFSALLAQARIGVLQYDAEHLEKSTLFAALCAHGTPTLCVGGMGAVFPWLPANVVAGTWQVRGITSVAANELSILGRRLEEQYQSHSLERHASFVQALIGSTIRLTGSFQITKDTSLHVAH